MLSGKLTKQGTTFDRLSLFSFLWAVATLFHAISFYDDISLWNPFTWLDIVAAVILIAFPRSVLFFLLLLCFRIAHVAEWMPFTPNHILFEFVLNIGILLTLLWTLSSSYVKEHKLNSEDPKVRKRLFNAFAPVARVSLFVLYFYAVLHKLNWDYFNPAISCSTVLMDGVIESRLPFLPSNPLIHQLAIWGTLVLEAGIPLLLIFKRTRWAGILIGLGFHYFLSIHPHGGIYSFSSMLFALFFLFTPPSFPKKLNIFIGLLLKRWQAVSSIPKVVLLLAASSVLVFIGINWQYRPDIAGFLYWSIWTMLFIFVYVAITFFATRSRDTGFAETFSMANAWFWAIPLLLLFNGMSPYLGLKTQTSFSMFSNLRTEGGKTNHIFIPSTAQVYGWQQDLVEVVASDFDPLLKIHGKDQAIPFFEFRRVVSHIKKDFYVKYRRNGEVKVLKMKGGVSNNPELVTPPLWLVEKVFFFRPVDKGPCECKH